MENAWPMDSYILRLAADAGLVYVTVDDIAAMFCELGARGGGDKWWEELRPAFYHQISGREIGFRALERASVTWRPMIHDIAVLAGLTDAEVRDVFDVDLYESTAFPLRHRERVILALHEAAVKA